MITRFLYPKYRRNKLTAQRAGGGYKVLTIAPALILTVLVSGCSTNEREKLSQPPKPDMRSTVKATWNPDPNQSAFPILACNFPQFGGRDKCYEWQEFWDASGREGYEENWINCTWNPAARECWNLNQPIWRCPLQGGLNITLGEVLDLHDWSVRIFRAANDDGAWNDHRRAGRIVEYLNLATMDVLKAYGFKEQIENEIAQLTLDDIVYLAKILLRYSSINDTEDWFKYLLPRIAGCSNQTTHDRVDQLHVKWKELAAL